jgi:hypothetical protein
MTSSFEVDAGTISGGSGGYKERLRMAVYKVNGVFCHRNH